MEALELQRIQFSGHPAKRHDIVLSSDEVVVGRSPQCTCVIADVHISRRHVRFAREDGRWTVTDLSTNGILLNGAPLPRGEPTPLAVSDRLRLDPPGKFLYRVSEPADRPPPAKRALASEEQLKRMEEEKRELEAKLKEENEQLEERLRQVQEQLRGQQEQAEREREEAERAAKEREEYAKKMAALKEEMEKKEQEMEEEKRAREERLRRQLQEQEAALKEQLAAEVARLQQERDNIENQLKGAGCGGPAAARPRRAPSTRFSPADSCAPSGGQADYPCGECGLECDGTACVACDRCGVWHHFACLRLSRRQRRRIESVQWLCGRCRRQVRRRTE